MIGEMNQRARLLARMMTSDGGGGFSESWSTIATVWAKLNALSGGDVYGPDAVESRVRFQIAVRRNDAAVAGNRVAIGARTFRIHAVLDDGGTAVTLLCEELP